MASAVMAASAPPCVWDAFTSAKPMLTRLPTAAEVSSTSASVRESSSLVARAAVVAASRCHTVASVQMTTTALVTLQPIITATCHGPRPTATAKAPSPAPSATSARVRASAKRGSPGISRRSQEAAPEPEGVIEDVLERPGHHEHDEEENPEAVLTEAVPRRGPRRWEEALDHRRPVEGRDGQQVERRQDHVDEAEEERPVAWIAPPDEEAKRRLSGNDGERVHQHDGQQRQRDVGRGTGEADEQGLLPGMTKTGQIHRHRLGPAEHPRSRQRQDQREDDRPERIDMGDGIECQPPCALGGVVTERQRHRS